MRQMTARGRAFIEKEEGLRLAAYDDATGRPVPVGGHVQGVLTIGIGHTGPDVVPGMKITREQADALFDKDNDWAERVVEQNMIGPKGELPNDNQFDACVSLAFNIGAPAFAKSSIARNWQKGRWKESGDAFALYNRDKFGVNTVLVGRRAREMGVFFTPAPRPYDVEARVNPPVMPQSVAPPPGAAKSPTVIATVASAAGGATIVAKNIQPALDAVDGAVQVARQANTTLDAVKDLFASLNNGHVLTVLILSVTVGIGIYVAVRVVRRIWSGQARAN
jgi:lysozyme